MRAVASTQESRRSPEQAAVPSPASARGAAPPNRTASIAHASSARTVRGEMAGREAIDNAVPAPSTSPLQTLREESARLEALVALARDERMASAPAMVLAADAEDRVRMVDAALSSPGLGDAEQLDLWTRRVAALRELAGIEGTNRWLAAQGESLQGAVALVD